MSVVDEAATSILCQPIRSDAIDDEILKNSIPSTTNIANETEESNLSKIPIYNYINDVIKNHVSDVELTAVFDQESSYKNAYYRNNKANGQKHIRCFPYCADVHSDKAFCGRPVSIVVSMLVKMKSNGEQDYSGKFDNMKFLSYFKPQDASILFDQNLTPSELKNVLLRKEGTNNIIHNTTTVFLGKVIYRMQPVTTPTGIVHRCLVEFNADCKGWHYSWTGNRFTPTEKHVLSVSAVVPEICDSDVPRSMPQLYGFNKLRDNSNFKDTHSYTSDVPNESEPFPFQIRYKPIAHFSSPPFTVASMRGRREKVFRLNISPTPHPPQPTENEKFAAKSAKKVKVSAADGFGNNNTECMYNNDHGDGDDDNFDEEEDDDDEEEDEEDEEEEDYFEDIEESVNNVHQSTVQTSSSTDDPNLSSDGVQGNGNHSTNLFRETMSIMQSDDYEKIDGMEVDGVTTQEGMVTRRVLKKVLKAEPREKKTQEKAIKAQDPLDSLIEPRNPLKGVGGVSIAELHLKANILQITVDHKQARNFIDSYHEQKARIENRIRPPCTTPTVLDIVTLPKRKLDSHELTLRHIDTMKSSNIAAMQSDFQSNEEITATTSSSHSPTVFNSEEQDRMKYFKPNPKLTLETLVASRALMHDSFEADSSGAISLLALVADYICTGGTLDDNPDMNLHKDPFLLSSLSRENHLNDTILYQFTHPRDLCYSKKVPNTKFSTFHKLTCNFHRNNTFSLVSEQAKNANSLSSVIPSANSQLKYKVGDKVWATDGISSFANVETYYSGEILTYNSDFSLVLIEFSRVGKFETSDTVARHTWLPSFYVESHVHLGDRRNRKTKRRP